jgi:hypothetical protein
MRDTKSMTLERKKKLVCLDFIKIINVYVKNQRQENAEASHRVREHL